MAETDEMALATVAASGPVDAVIIIAVLVTVHVPADSSFWLLSTPDDRNRGA
jgi:hypothetical protein